MKQPMEQFRNKLHKFLLNYLFSSGVKVELPLWLRSRRQAISISVPPDCFNQKKQLDLEKWRMGFEAWKEEEANGITAILTSTSLSLSLALHDGNIFNIVCF
ncbi:hypothetical protein CXB51_003553 [Gossypium anomalum]|uniref:Uncharacterized protein n=1 Tax=Gossypium anomalum TaxID=47600 RepID=A0A8J5ZIZ8_9ROSI|nr:hypothetical protein CXB51_003553 [Gossypium anomalum]